jgi:hypothetical protein
MCDGEYERALGTKFERNQIWELIENGPPNRSRSGFRPRPDGIESRSFFDA